MSEENKTSNTTRHSGIGRRGVFGGHGGGPAGALGRPVEKAKNFKGTLNRLLAYLKPQRVNLTIVVIFAIVATVFTVMGPKITGNAMNQMTDGFISKSIVNGINSAQLQMADQMKSYSNLQKQMAAAQANPQASAQSGAGIDAATQALIDQMKKMTPDQQKALQDMAALPVIKSTNDYSKRADIARSFFNDIKKLPPSMVSGSSQISSSGLKTTNISTADLNKYIKDIRETGGSIPFNIVGQTLLFLLVIYVLSSVFTFVMQWVMSSVAQKVVYNLRKNVDYKLARLPLKYFDSHTNGEILSRMTNDIDTISTTLQQSLTQVIQSIFQLIGYIIMMLTISPILTLIVMATLPLYILVTMLIAKNSQRFFAAQQKHLGELSGHTEEMFTGHKIVKAFGHEQDAIETFEAVNDQLYDAGWKAQFLSGIMFPMMNFISNVGYVLISVVGGIFVTKTWLNIGDITAFISYSRSFSMPIIQTANIANVIQSTIACAERVFEVLDEEEEIPEPENAEVIELPRGDIKFDHVKFSYKENEPLIEDMNLDIKKGETIAIVGPTGAGKTTLVNLLMRFYEISGGRITFDGVDVRNMQRGNLRTMFGMVLQDTWLFNGTIEDNIKYGREDATHEEIVAAAKAAHANHFIRSLPDGYNTVLNEEASNISQGQKQLLTIARAILADPAVLILDEATSSVDTRTEVLIQKAMGVLMVGRTNFVIAHRLSTIRDAKLILVMNHGSIIESGTHTELLAQNGFYADLYNSQFTGPAIDEQVV
jgi:ATP-binding cassette subfamily B multidrug efflux pump